jgi:hypothetical protein
MLIDDVLLIDDEVLIDDVLTQLAVDYPKIDKRMIVSAKISSNNTKYRQKSSSQSGYY